jgi:hypothetical protein
VLTSSTDVTTVILITTLLRQIKLWGLQTEFDELNMTHLPRELWGMVGGYTDTIEDLVALCSTCRAVRFAGDLLLGAWLQAKVAKQHTQIVYPRQLGFLDSRTHGT